MKRENFKVEKVEPGIFDGTKKTVYVKDLDPEIDEETGEIIGVKTPSIFWFKSNFPEFFKNFKNEVERVAIDDEPDAYFVRELWESGGEGGMKKIKKSVNPKSKGFMHHAGQVIGKGIRGTKAYYKKVKPHLVKAGKYVAQKGRQGVYIANFELQKAKLMHLLDSSLKKGNRKVAQFYVSKISKLYDAYKLPNPVKSGVFAKYIHERLEDPRHFQRNSFRTVPFGVDEDLMIVAKPKKEFAHGHYGSLKAQAILRAKNPDDEPMNNPAMVSQQEIKANTKGIGFYLPIDDKGKISLSLMGGLYEVEYFTVHNGKQKKIRISDRKLSVWESKDKNVIIIMKLPSVRFNVKGKPLQAMKNYKEFNWRNADKVMEANIDLKAGDRIVYIGTAIKLDYVSDKFDRRTRIHTHKFEGSHIVATNSKHTMIMIMPTSINERGILS